MGRIARVALDLLRFQVPVIDDILSLLTVIVVLAVFFGTIIFAVFWPWWHFLVRPVAATHGFVPLTGYDYVVRAWKAERRGDWADALKAYNLSVESFPRYLEAHHRRDALLAAHPELAPKAT